MKILQKPLSPEHRSAMFYNGTIARGKKDGKQYTLETEQDGKLLFMGNTFVGDEIIDLGNKDLINDEDIDQYNVDIYVDKYFAIKDGNILIDENLLIFDNYDEAIKEFNIFLNTL
jgi:hypothetical protein